MHIVTPDPDYARWELERHDILGDARLILHADDEVVPAEVMQLPGWSRQQYVKLHADEICDTSVVCCLGADTLICRRISAGDLWQDERPILYYSLYEGDHNHLRYEQERVRHIAALLDVEPKRSLGLGNFIMDFIPLHRDHLGLLRRHLDEHHGSNALLRLLPRESETLAQRVRFGEWTLHAVFLLDVLEAPVPLRNSANRFVAQIHSERDFESFDFDAAAIHFVPKTIAVNRILARIEAHARPGRGLAT